MYPRDTGIWHASALADTELTDAPNGIFQAQKNGGNEGKWGEMGGNGGKWRESGEKWAKMKAKEQKWGIHEHI